MTGLDDISAKLTSRKLRAGLVALVLLAGLALVQSSRAQTLQPAAFLPVVVRQALVETTRTPTATATATATVTPRPTTTPRPAPTATPTRDPRLCDPSYPTVCIPPPPPDLDCSDIPYTDFVVLPPDPHGFDRDHDGIGCETRP